MGAILEFQVWHLIYICASGRVAELAYAYGSGPYESNLLWVQIPPRPLFLMQKRVFIVHGWSGFPEEGWFPWLKKELESRDYKVQVPQLPDAGNPRIEKWVPKLAEVVGIPDEQTYFVGHSIGCQTIARYLESLSADVRVGGAVFVAGFFKRLTNLEPDEETQETARLWLETPINLEKVKTHLPQSIAIFSDNDPYVPLDNQDDLRSKLGSEIIIEHQTGHFSGPSDGVTKLPVVLEAILKISK